MGFNAAGTVAKDVNVPLTLATFGGLVTQWPPMNLPEGSSPDNQECIFNPGKVGARPAFQKILATPIGTATFTYGKSYIDPTAVIRNLYITSDGQILMQNGGLSAIPSNIGSTTPGAYAQSVTAFGREYIAISDGLHGQEVPLQYDGTNLDRVTQDGPGAPPSVANLAGTAVDLTSLTRASNIVTAVTASPHGLIPGYQALIANMAATSFTISKVQIANATLPGVATVTTTVPHGLTPGLQVTLSNIAYVDVPFPITAALRESQLTTITFGGAHGLFIGAQITIVGTVDNSFLGNRVVTGVPTPTQISYVENDATPFNGSEVGNARLNYPSTVAVTVTILDCPTPTTFQYALAYGDATWVSGNVYYQWDGTYYVSTVVSSTSFTYANPGPDGMVNTSSPATATVTPSGQIAPGVHQMQVLYITRNKAITRPSPLVQFTANGGQYLSVTNIPTGPPNVVGRILAFTGTDGSEFFYIPVPAQVNGQIVSTATQINDNTTTSVVLDFGDPTLFAGIGISEMGNDLAAQIILDSCLSFGYYGNRLIAYGIRNRIQNMLGMSFDSGTFSGTPTIPTGWTKTGSPGALATGHFGQGWNGSGSGSLSQSFYLDYTGAPIGTPNQTYRFRAWLAAGATVTATIHGGSPSFTSTATLTAGASAGWFEAAFSLAMPAKIGTDFTFSITATGLIDEMSVIYADNPYLDRVLFGSYELNPEGFDGLSGKFGPTDDTHKIMGCAVIRATFYMLTQDPNGRLHSTSDNGVTEPAGWTVSEVATQCGMISAFGLTVSQADDATGAGGEEWMAWASQTGARIFGGDQAWMISEEIQPDWNSINPAAFPTIWALNDSVNRRIYFGLPLAATAPNVIYHVDYKNLNGAFQIAQASPLSGFRRANGDYCRKWTRWWIAMNSAAVLFNVAGQSYPVFLGGNGARPNTAPGFGNIYFLASQATDDDYGQFFPYYTTYFFPGPELENAVGLGAGRKTLAYFQFLAEIPLGSSLTDGHVQVSVYIDQLNNPWPLVCQRNLVQAQQFDLEWPGGSAEGQRMAFRFDWFPGAI